jgi:prolyl oligopeptidase
MPVSLRALAVLLLAALPMSARSQVPAPPPTRAEVVRDTLHGVVSEDPYRWLEDKDSPETRAWVREQMAFTRRQLDQVPGMEQVKATIAKFARSDTRTEPAQIAGRLFFTRRAADQQQSVLCMRTSPTGPDVVLEDANTMSVDHTVSVGLADVSLDGKLVAYNVRKGGEDETVVKLLDPDTHQELPGGLPRARYFGISIDPAKQGCWYGRWEPKGSRIWYHRFGDDPSKDKMIFGDGLGPVEIPVVQLSENGHWLSITVFKGSSSTDTKVYVREASSDGPFASVTDTLHALVNTSFAGDQIVIRTDWKAPNCRLMVVDAKAPGFAHWKELVPERKDAVLTNYSTGCGRVFAKYLHEVRTEIASFDLLGKPRGAVTLPGLGDAGAPSGEWGGTSAYYTFQSFNRPPTIFRWDATSGASSEWWRSSAPIDPDRYAVTQEWVTSRDGTRVPMFVVARKGLVRDGSNPVLLSGYGGFSVAELPVFSSRIASWLELGGVYVLANMRGGDEFGEEWHRAGMLSHKQNVFDDFEAAGQWLVDNKICTPSRLAIMGGSNGGLLVGAAMAQKPELFGAVLCEVPLLDMLRYQRFLVARFWVPEYGSAEDPQQFQWLRAYSPYQNVKPGVAYPPIMLVSGDSDTRVDPLHARKMAAKLQSFHGPNPVLLHYDVNSGHSAGKSVDQTIDDMADEMQFLRSQLRMAGPVN